jgi:hypothetical protein
MAAPTERGRGKVILFMPDGRTRIATFSDPDMEDPVIGGEKAGDVRISRNWQREIIVWPDLSEDAKGNPGSVDTCLDPDDTITITSVDFGSNDVGSMFDSIFSYYKMKSSIGSDTHEWLVWNNQCYAVQCTNVGPFEESSGMGGQMTVNIQFKVVQEAP